MIQEITIQRGLDVLKQLKNTLFFNSMVTILNNIIFSWECENNNFRASEYSVQLRNIVNAE